MTTFDQSTKNLHPLFSINTDTGGDTLFSADQPPPPPTLPVTMIISPLASSIIRTAARGDKKVLQMTPTTTTHLSAYHTIPLSYPILINHFNINCEVQEWRKDHRPVPSSLVSFLTSRRPLDCFFFSFISRIDGGRIHQILVQTYTTTSKLRLIDRLKNKAFFPKHFAISGHVCLV